MITLFFPSYWRMRARIAALSADNRGLHQLLDAQKDETARAESEVCSLRKKIGALEAEINGAIALNCQLRRHLDERERRRDERGRCCK